MDGRFCPRRIEDGADKAPFRVETDEWQERSDGYRHCSYCGSISPEEFMRDAKAGVKLGPTDKDYKIYVDGQRKFYFQHLPRPQRLEFLQLLNRGELNFGYPGHLYVLPFFIKAI